MPKKRVRKKLADRRKQAKKITNLQTGTRKTSRLKIGPRRQLLGNVPGWTQAVITLCAKTGN